MALEVCFGAKIVVQKSEVEIVVTGPLVELSGHMGWCKEGVIRVV